MGLCCCDKCWERPCVCGHEAREAEAFRAQYFKNIELERKKMAAIAAEYGLDPLRDFLKDNPGMKGNK